MIFYLMISLIPLGVIAYLCGVVRARLVVDDQVSQLHSRPTYHGIKLVLISVGPVIFLLIGWLILVPIIKWQMVVAQFGAQLQELTSLQLEVLKQTILNSTTDQTGDNAPALAHQGAVYFQNLSANSDILLICLCSILILFGFYFGFRSITKRTPARHFVERIIRLVLLVASGVAVLTTIGIVFSLLFETIRFFGKVSVYDFLFGLHWSPQSAFEGADADGNTSVNSLVFGAVPLFAGTFMITGIAILIAAPIGLMSAIYLSDYAGRRFRSIAKPLLEILAGVPTVVYGFFAVLTIAPAIRGFGEGIGLSVASESALAAGIVMGIMIIPFVSSLSDDVINAVPQSLRDGSAALGATKSETIRQVVLPAALPGIVSAILLSVSRAVGETMIVVMAAGLAANLTINPLEAVTTVTVQIVTLLVGDQEFDSAKTLAAFALGLVLFVLTLILNIIALGVVRKYREQYD